MHSSMAVERSCNSKVRLCTGWQKFVRNAADVHSFIEHIMKISESVHQDVVNGIVCYVMFVEHRNIKLHNVNVPQSKTWVELQREQINPFFVQRHLRIPFVQQLEVFLVPHAKPIDIKIIQNAESIKSYRQAKQRGETRHPTLFVATLFNEPTYSKYDGMI